MSCGFCTSRRCPPHTASTRGPSAVESLNERVDICDIRDACVMGLEGGDVLRAALMAAKMFCAAAKEEYTTCANAFRSVLG